MFRSYECSLTMTCSAQSPKSILPNVASPGSQGTQYRVGGVTFVEQLPCTGCHAWTLLLLSH